MADLRFKTKKEFVKFINSVKKCITEDGYCCDMYDHYYFHKGKRIRKGSRSLPIFIGDIDD